MTVKALKPGSNTFVLVLYETNGSDKSEASGKRWDVVKKGCKQVGLTVVGFSSDGAEPLLKTMKHMTSFYNNGGRDGQQFPCPPEFQTFFQARWDLNEPCVINDPVH